MHGGLRANGTRPSPTSAKNWQLIQRTPTRSPAAAPPGAKEEYDKAIADYDQALVINPKDAFVYCRRGTAWEKKGAYDKAIADYRKGSAIDPDSPWGYDGMAWLYANCPQAKYRDGKKAVKNAAKGAGT